MTEYEMQLESDRNLFRDSFVGSIFPILKNGVWHTTNSDAFGEIIETGLVKPSDSSRPFTFPQTQNSFSLANGYVSLFDFESATEDQCVYFYSKWSKFFSKHHPFTVAIEFDRAALGSRFLPAATAKNGPGSDTVWIPHVEAWHDGPIELSAVKRYLFIPWGKNKVIRDIQAKSPDLAAMIEEVRATPRVDPALLYC